MPREPTTHTVAIDVSWLSAGKDDGRHEWRATCSCGWEGPWRMTPKIAERDGATHRGTK